VRSKEMSAYCPLRAFCRRSSGLILGYLEGEGEVAQVYGLQGFTWADSLEEERLFLERI